MHLTHLRHLCGLTGFIVDKKRGLILTNRHVVTPGRSMGRQSAQDQDLSDLGWKAGLRVCCLQVSSIRTPHQGQ